MSDLGMILANQFPDASPIDDYRVEDHGDGKGPIVGLWNEKKLGPKPDAAQIDTWRKAFKPRGRAKRELNAAAMLASDDRKELADVLDGSPAEIAAYVDGAVTDLASAKALLVKMLLVIALRR